MNLELLEEIHILKENGKSDSDIASSLGLQKNILLMCLRMEKIISNKYKNIINENLLLNNDLELLKQKCIILEEEVNDFKSLNEIELLEEISNYENSFKEYTVEYNKLQKKYGKIPNFIKNWFE